MTTEIEDLTGHRIDGIDNIVNFAMGGRAIFTVRNKETGNRVTYRIDKVKDSDDDYIVSAFTGSDNASKAHYSVLGHIHKGFYAYRGLRQATLDLIDIARDNKDAWLVDFAIKMAGKFKRGWALSAGQEECLRRNLKRYGVKTSKVAEDDMKAKVFWWLYVRHINPAKELPEQVEFWHEGRCGCCGRRLTVPTSIAIGIGPICAGSFGVTSESAA